LKKLSITFLAIFIIIFPLMADTDCMTNSGNNFYISLAPSLIFPFSIETDSPDLSPATTNTEFGAGINLALGYRLQAWHLEGEIAYGNNKGKDIKINDPAYAGGDIKGNYSMWAATINLFYDIQTCLKTTPYIGAGLGVRQFQANDITLADDPPTLGCNNIFTYNFKAGFSHPLSPVCHLLFGYHFTGMGEQEFKTGADILNAEPIQTNSLELGIRFYL